MTVLKAVIVNLVKIAAVMIIVIMNVLVTVIQVVVVVVDPVAQVALELTVLLVEPRVLEVVAHHVHRLYPIFQDPHFFFIFVYLGHHNDYFFTFK